MRVGANIILLPTNEFVQVYEDEKKFNSLLGER